MLGRLALAAAALLAAQAPALADCNSIFCHLCCYPRHRHCQVPCPTILNEATFGYFPTQWQPWPVAVSAAPLRPEPLPAPPVEKARPAEKAMPRVP
jgi:hypothetical protein